MLQGQLIISADTKNAKKKTNIAYVKVHKCGSTTMTSTFLRFAEINRMELPFCKSGWPYISYPTTRQEIYTPEFRSNDRSKYNILAVHTMYNYTLWNRVMKHPFTLVGAAREPFNQFESFFTFYKFHDFISRKYKMPQSETLDFFLNEFNGRLKDEKWEFHGMSTQRIRNTMLLDYGMPLLDHSRNESGDVLKYINELTANVTVFIIQDYFDESLVVLKNILCWNWSDIVYDAFIHQRTPSPSGSLKSTNMSLIEERRRLHKIFSPYDYIFYGKSFSKLQSQIESITDFAEQLQEFRDIKSIIAGWCESSERSPSDTLKLPVKYHASQITTIDDFGCSRLKIKTWQAYSDQLLKSTTAKVDWI
ncbi:galactosylceramide sulfotransferase-like [Symsagittifera roscoffensis]|uniref:galactosylceramide sulfotransferase-like n=1 Tax=Symsagittifera roscoffensis TaxID=84072 RepID=UPI00307BFEA2